MISQTVRFVRGFVVSLAIAVLAGCAANGPVSAPASDTNADRAVAVAVQQIGVPYRYGGSTPGGFDCSGLVHYSYAQAGKTVPRTTATLWSELRPVSERDLRAGDVLFFRIAGKMSHVGLYVGGGEFVHAPSSGKVVSIGSLRSDFYADAFIRAGRPN
ncbi:MAG: C40 family peptidase [Woeseiaceae bacterium]